MKHYDYFVYPVHIKLKPMFHSHKKIIIHFYLILFLKLTRNNLSFVSTINIELLT